MAKQRILFIGGSLNQTRMTHAVARHLQGAYDCHFTPYYADGLLAWLARRGLLDFTVLGGAFRRQTDAYLAEHRLPVDFGGRRHGPYDLIVTTSDLLVQRNLRHGKVILIQEGMTDPETAMYHLVRRLRLPRYLASTATTGLSDRYDYFCVASEGYRDLFVQKGARPDKLVVTGIPNFDNLAAGCGGGFPYNK
ncbi:MAG: hypothetical protein KC425_15830 [Anaerolineales bacterium]|nr:hypothetical protein [Anaerolineales bacterium]